VELFLLRHGIAVDHGAPGYKKDSERPLTEEGIHKMELIASAMKEMGLSFDRILSSPYVRARETAEIVSKQLDLKKQLKFSDHLAVEGNPRKLIDEINQDHKTAESLLLVGHEPSLSSLISLLVTGNPASIFTMKKGGFCKMSVSALSYRQCAVFEWLLTPKQMLLISRP
jgi:phosphohistidine phosphatase